MTTWFEEAENEPPQVQIEQVGRFTYMLTLVHGIMAEAPSTFVLGRRWAESKARRMLRRYQRQERRRANVRTITGEAA